MKTDIEIAQSIQMRAIADIANRLHLDEADWEPYGRYKAKLDLSLLHRPRQQQGKLVLVTGMSPTPAGEGKSTVTVGLGQALHQLNKNAIVCIREPSLGPNFGLKGGAAGGGYAQILPMADLNLHFTGDFHAITTAHNLLSALIDNHLHQGNALHLDPKRVVWKRVVDLNDRSLRRIIVGLGDNNGVVRESGFDITVASEMMAILCLVESFSELKEALGAILIGYTYDKQPVTVHDLGAEGALAVLLKDAIRPNLVQTLEGTPAIVHGGPFGNIAHGCNSLIATKMALNLGEYVVTEAGFGSDLGAEKFFDIKSRKGGLHPDAAVIVVTVRAMKYHGGVRRSELTQENLEAIKRGFENVKHHARIVSKFGVPFVIALNRFADDTEAELTFVEQLCDEQGFMVSRTEVWAQGGLGGVDLAQKVVAQVESGASNFRPLYPLEAPLVDKIERVATEVYEAAGVVFSDVARRQLAECEANGWGNLAVCIAKTPYSFSDDATLRGQVSGFQITVREVRASLGAGFIVCLTGDIMTMPGLPKIPNALKIDIDEQGTITGLF
ncbi:hypothetical protein N007_09160 [Alicyclobacillus acidoterrestris ATCC 49025]|nr:hypothetical protein N007_09160 [Alicyclobacillus acidoterrestris ATCC 49025]